MAELVVTNAEVFSDLDPAHSIVSIRRVGRVDDDGNPAAVYQVLTFANARADREPASYTAAVKLAKEIAADIEADPIEFLRRVNDQREAEREQATAALRTELEELRAADRARRMTAPQE